jgi:hypothetical protein
VPHRRERTGTPPTDAVLTAHGIIGLPSPDSLGNLAPNSWVSSVQAAFQASTAWDLPTTAADPELFDPTGGLANHPGATDPGDGTDAGRATTVAVRSAARTVVAAATMTAPT